MKMNDKSPLWIDRIDQITKSFKNMQKREPDPLDPVWNLYYNDGSRQLQLNHREAGLDDILQNFEDFCKGAGFVFSGFAIVDEDGIPVNGLNPLARLEATKDED